MSAAETTAPSQQDLRDRHYALYKSLLPSMIRRLEWDRATLDAFQAAALRTLLDHAQIHSPFHAARLAGIDIHAPGLRISDLPTMSKPDLMENWDRIVTIPGASRAAAAQHLRTTVDTQYLWGDNVLMASGGTGGSPGLFVYDFDALAINWASMSRSMMAILMRRFGVNHRFRVASIGTGVSAHGSYVMGRIFSDPDNQTRSFPLWETPSNIFPALTEFNPDTMFCTSGYALQLLAGHQQGTLRISPTLIFLSSEALSDVALARMRAAWPDTLFFTCWGTTEAAGTFPCPSGDGFHISEDGVIIEPLDEHGQPCKPGEWSHSILLTNLYNRAMPLIRYRIDDIFEFAETPCSCGLAYRKVNRVHGRSTERFVYGAISIHAGLVELAILEQPSIQEYQIAQTTHGVAIRYSAASAADESRMRERMTHDLANFGLAAAEIQIERVDHIVRSSAGKLQRFVPLPA